MYQEKLLTSAVVICTRNRLKDLLRMLDSLSLQTYSPQEIIVVDSSDVPLNQQNEFSLLFNNIVFPHSKIIYTHTAPGLTKQRNVGIALAQSDIIYFFDDDVQLEPYYLKSMQNVFSHHYEYAGGMGCVTNVAPPPSKKYVLWRKIFLLQRDYADGMFTASGMPTHVYGTNTFKGVQVLGGCCFAFRKKILEKYLFDEKLGNYACMEDCDISKRISDQHKLFFNPAAKLAHHHSPTARDNVKDNRAMFIKNYSYLFFKNFYPQNKWRVLAYWSSIMGLFLEALLFRRFDELRGYCAGLRTFFTMAEK